MPTATTTKTANDVANLFFVQKLEDEKSRVQRWQREFVEAMEDEELSSVARHAALYLYVDCIEGKIDTTISHKQGCWLSKMLAQEQRWHKRTPHTIIYQGRELGTWTYQGATSRDPYERMTFRVDPAFMQEYTGVDPTILERAKRLIEEDEA